MKNIIDFYECGLNAGTPANTLGMGNPMPATDTTLGSEPLIPAKKCKNTKCKKEKIDEASLLGDIEDTIQAGDDVVEFAQWFLEATIEGFSFTDSAKLKIDFDDYLPKIIDNLKFDEDTSTLLVGDKEVLTKDDAVQDGDDLDFSGMFD